MFSDLYDWAGKYRNGNFQKNGYTFFDYHRFNFAEEDINALLHKLSKKDILSTYDYAQILDKVNYMHPFREGNGRSAKIFLSCIAGNHAQVIDYPRDNTDMIKAQNNADLNGIARLIRVQNAPNRDVAFKLMKELQRNKKK